MIWFLGVFVILLGFEVRSSQTWQWALVWGIAGALWFFVGCIALLYRMSRAAFDKTRAGALDAFRRGLSTPPAPRKEGQ